MSVETRRHLLSPSMGADFDLVNPATRSNVTSDTTTKEFKLCHQFFKLENGESDEPSLL